MKEPDFYEQIQMPASEIRSFTVETHNNAAEYNSDSAEVFDEDGYDATGKPVPGRPGRQYITYGADDELPYKVINMIGSDEVMAQNKFFNVLTCYGAGTKLMDIATDRPTTNRDIRRWMIHNSIPMFSLEQATDMKYFFFAVTVLILSRDGKRINRFVHKEACHCRFEKANAKGIIEHIYYANWRKSGLQKEDVEEILLLDEKDPLGDLEVRLGLAPGTDGLTRVRTKERKFAIVTRFPTPGKRYYPSPYYTSIFRGDWYDIKKLIGKGKKAKLRNHTSVRYQVEIHKDYWPNLCRDEHITDPVKAMERIKKEKENITKFVSGIENSGKVWITGYYLDPNGREQRMVRVNLLDTGKEGGDWSEDIEEASNITCYGDNIHPNLVGATPGKSQTNNSGSDKRELFTLKQALETSFHDLMKTPYEVMLYFNGWEQEVYVDVPMILLTTLDKGTDAKKKSVNGKETDVNED